MLALGSPLTAVVTKIRSPQIIGDELPMPGIGVFQRTLRPESAFQAVGGCWPSATPDAPGPRNEGQFCGMMVPAIASSVPGAGRAGDSFLYCDVVTPVRSDTPTT